MSVRQMIKMYLSKYKKFLLDQRNFCLTWGQMEFVWNEPKGFFFFWFFFKGDHFHFLFQYISYNSIDYFNVPCFVAVQLHICLLMIEL